MQLYVVGALIAAFIASLFAIGLAVTPARADDGTAGKKLFKQRCGICHTVVADKKKIGPSLFGVVGREAGTERYFKYSPALVGSGLTWDEATLDKGLTKPKALVPKTKMAFPGLKKPDQHVTIIAFLKTLR